MSKGYWKYSPEFREEVVKLVIDTSRAITDVAREYGVHDTTRGNWVRDYKEKYGGETEERLAVNERARLRELERKNRELEMKCAFLQKQRRTLQRSIGTRQVRVYLAAGNGRKWHRRAGRGPAAGRNRPMPLVSFHGLPMRADGCLRAKSCAPDLGVSSFGCSGQHLPSATFHEYPWVMNPAKEFTRREYPSSLVDNSVPLLLSLWVWCEFRAAACR
jgi:transposase-like protein